MFVENLKIGNYNDRDYRLSINAAWITIKDNQTGKTLYKRAADVGPWYDDTHKKIMQALYQLEKAVFNAVDNEVV